MEIVIATSSSCRFRGTSSDESSARECEMRFIAPPIYLHLLIAEREYGGWWQESDDGTRQD